MINNDSIKSMDINILVSILNMKLRDFYKNLEDLCEDLDIDEKNLEQILVEKGYSYSEESNSVKEI